MRKVYDVPEFGNDKSHTNSGNPGMEEEEVGEEEEVATFAPCPSAFSPVFSSDAGCVLVVVEDDWWIGSVVVVLVALCVVVVVVEGAEKSMYCPSQDWLCRCIGCTTSTNMVPIQSSRENTINRHPPPLLEAKVVVVVVALSSSFPPSNNNIMLFLLVVLVWWECDLTVMCKPL